MNGGIQEEILHLRNMGLLDPLLKDMTTGENIIWGTDAHRDLGRNYERDQSIRAELIVGDGAGVIQNRAGKAREAQSERTRQHAEVFTPLWICEKMNDHADAVLKDRKPGKKPGWQQYVDARILEITCGEAPYLVSRYDVSTGEPVPMDKRIGMLDRKLKAVSENTETEADWLYWVKRAYYATYGYEFQGDNLLIARINMLMTFEEAMQQRWSRLPTVDEYTAVLRIVVFNLWQMDGLTGALPYALAEPDFVQTDMFSLLGMDTAAAQTPTKPPCIVYDWIGKHKHEFLKMQEGRYKMKFDFIIGNPPYQEETESQSTRMPPVYDRFMDAAFQVGEKVELITPARFLFDAGQTPKAWNKKMLEDPHLSVLCYMQNASSVFHNTDIKGGVAITYHDSKTIIGPIGTFVAWDELRSIIKKAGAKSVNDSLTDIADSSNVYDLKSIYDDHPDYRKYIADNGRHAQLKTNVLNINPIFTDAPTAEDDYVVYGLVEGKRGRKYCHRKYLKSKHKSLFKYKVLVPKATGSGQFGDTFPSTVIAAPNDAFTQTYISVGTFDTEQEAINLSKYLKTKLCRALLYVLKVTQDNLPAVWKCIPKQDFTQSSDINWSASIAEIDRQLYKKYSLTAEEITFIETHVKEME